MDLGPKFTDEIKVVKFPFAVELNGAAIAVAAATTCTVLVGTDASAGAMVLGVATVVGTDVLQRVQNGVDGNTYRLRAKVTDNAGNVHVIAARMQVKDTQ